CAGRRTSSRTSTLKADGRARPSTRSSTASGARGPGDGRSILRRPRGGGRLRVRATFDQNLRDVGRIPSDARQHVRGGRVLERETDELQPGGARSDPALVDRLALLAEDREVDPREVLPEAGAPDDVRHVDDVAVLEDRCPLSDADRSWDAGD